MIKASLHNMMPVYPELSNAVLNLDIFRYVRPLIYVNYSQLRLMYRLGLVLHFPLAKLHKLEPSKVSSHFHL